MPERIQRRRTAGWRMPEGAVYVGRPTSWGNPFAVRPMGPVEPIRAGMWGVFVDRRVTGETDERPLVRWDTKELALTDAQDRFHRYLTDRARLLIGSLGYPWEYQIRLLLAGKNLACWCRLDQPCHADVLLEVANGPTP